MHRFRASASTRSILVLGAAIAVVAAACSGGSTVETGERPDVPRAASSATSPLPDVTVWDVGSAEWVQFADILPATTPVVLWFWAPHCPACAAEASEMTAFAEENADAVTVIGIGTQDDAGMAADFVDRHDIPFRMLWDETFESWAEFDISSQPASALLAPDGQLIETWTGPLPGERVVDLLAGVAGPA